MAAPVSGPSTPDHGGMIPADWPAQAADTIVETIGKVRDKTTKPAIVAARGLVYGLLVAIAGTILLILLLILVVRGIDYLPGIALWVGYAVLGALFSIVGLWALRRANRPARTT